ncbi:transposase [Streptomyces sp. NPDC050625]|uniref:IS110 family transposase n=1 Tax=Streptomyces sp. NPDC050625 TaxID=3154629 RepID=UPI00341D7EB4
MQAYVGIDVHRRRSQIYVMDGGSRLAVNRNVPNGRETLREVIGDLPVGTPVAFEAAFGWGRLLELLQDHGFEPHLAHPLQCRAIAAARLKNDRVDGETLAHLLRADLLPEAWIAPPHVRRQGTILRHRTAVGAVAHVAAQPDPRGARRSRIRPQGRGAQLLERSGP